MKQLFIIRGLPGVGKTTLALQLTPHIAEADMFFLEQDGTYKFDMTKLPQAHEECEKSVEYWMEREITPIAVSNTFTRRWEMEAYYQLAREHGYRVTEITLSGELHGSIHDVPETTIKEMRFRWER